MRRLLETRHHERVRRGFRSHVTRLVLLASLVMLGQLACKTPRAAAPAGGPDEGAPATEPAERTPDPAAAGQEQTRVAGDCEAGKPYLLGVIPRPRKDCLGADFMSRLTWQVFIALQWTADTSKRGVALRPEDEKELGKTGVPRVWETWKQDWELSSGEQKASSPWDSYAMSRPPCDFLEKPGQKRVRVTARSWPRIFEAGGRVLLDKINLVKDDPEHELSFVFTGPLIDANGDYVRYETRFNQALYDCARDGSGPGCTAEPLSLPAFTGDSDGAVSVKAAWRALAGEGEKADYHWRDVLVLYYEKDRKGKPVAVCKPETHVLLGMHVIYKNGFVTTGPNQWIWATFEHQDLEQLAPSCKGGDEPWKGQGYSYEPPALVREALPAREQRTPVELCRRKAVLPVTAQANSDYQRFLPAPWGSYRIAAMQWLIGGKNTPPSLVSNVILEAYAQGDSCMGCHNEQAGKGDFLWTLALEHEDELPIAAHAEITDPNDLWR